MDGAEAVGGQILGEGDLHGGQDGGGVHDEESRWHGIENVSLWCIGSSAFTRHQVHNMS